MGYSISAGAFATLGQMIDCDTVRRSKQISVRQSRNNANRNNTCVLHGAPRSPDRCGNRSGQVVKNAVVRQKLKALTAFHRVEVPTFCIAMDSLTFQPNTG